MKTQRVFWSSVVVFTLLLFIVPHPFIPSTLGSTILTVIAFLFGIIAGFYIVVTTTDYNSVKNILATETAGLIDLYDNAWIYDKQFAERLSQLIDAYIRRNLDFEIIDYAKKTQPEFRAIEEAIRELPFRSDLSSIYQTIRGIKHDIIIARQQMTVLGTKTLSGFQWAILSILAALFIASLYGLRTGEFFFSVVTVAMSSATILVLFLIRDLDLYVWNERTFGFDIFQNVFRAIGQLPYYPFESLEGGRIRPVENEYRVGILTGSSENDRRKIEIRTGK